VSDSRLVSHRLKARAAEFCLAGRMIVWIVALPLLKRVVPIRRLASLMSATRRSTQATHVDEERVCGIAGWLSRRLLPAGRGVCLEQSLVAYRFLSAQGSSPELIIGVGRRDGKFIAHAWIALGGRPIGDSPTAFSDLAPIVAFGPGGTVAHTPGALTSHFEKLLDSNYGGGG
jgi:hypothetical protein